MDTLFMIKNLYLLIFFCNSIFCIAQQNKIFIPELKNIVPGNFHDDRISLPSNMKFDMLIIYWGDIEYHTDYIYALGHTDSSWYKIVEKREIIELKRRRSRIDATTNCELLEKQKGDSLFGIILNNDLFGMADERMKRDSCNGYEKVIINGKERMFPKGGIATHRPVYKFEIQSLGRFKHIYFFDPYAHEEDCTKSELKSFLSCAKAFEKTLGN